MEQRIFHGKIQPEDFARSLIGQFNRGNLRVQQVGSGNQIVVQIATALAPASGGRTAVSITLQTVEDGVNVQVGKQAWFGVAASLGMTALSALRNPFALLGRLDDLAQDIEYMQLTNEVWQNIDETARTHQANFQLSERLRRLECPFCGTANPVGEPNCVSCGAPLGEIHPETCPRCGFVNKPGQHTCSNCGASV